MYRYLSRIGFVTFFWLNASNMLRYTLLLATHNKNHVPHLQSIFFHVSSILAFPSTRVYISLKFQGRPFSLHTCVHIRLFAICIMLTSVSFTAPSYKFVTLRSFSQHNWPVSPCSTRPSYCSQVSALWFPYQCFQNGVSICITTSLLTSHSRPLSPSWSLVTSWRPRTSVDLVNFSYTCPNSLFHSIKHV